MVCLRIWPVKRKVCRPRACLTAGRCEVAREVDRRQLRIERNVSEVRDGGFGQHRTAPATRRMRRWSSNVIAAARTRRALLWARSSSTVVHGWAGTSDGAEAGCPACEDDACHRARRLTLPGRASRRLRDAHRARPAPRAARRLSPPAAIFTAPSPLS